MHYSECECIEHDCDVRIGRIMTVAHFVLYKKPDYSGEGQALSGVLNRFFQDFGKIRVILEDQDACLQFRFEACSDLQTHHGSDIPGCMLLYFRR